MAKSRKTPSGQTRTGSERTDSRPDSRSKGEVPTIDKLEVATEESGPMSKNVGKSGLQGITQAEIDRTEFEEPTRLDSVHELGSVDEEEE
jgi:hypothetical protein